MKHLNPKWDFVADTVMGGVSTGTATQEIFEGRKASVLRGKVSLENNGGFIQMAFDLQGDATVEDAWDGIEVTICGNGEAYDIRLRTEQLTRPWQSFRTEVRTEKKWKTVRILFSEFEAHRVEATLDTSCLRRIGIVAIGHEFSALVAVSGIGFYQST